MIVRLALAAHSKLVGVSLDVALPVGEAAFKQHISLQVGMGVRSFLSVQSYGSGTPVDSAGLQPKFLLV